MRIGPIAHGALLVAALAFAYQTWTREKTEDPKVGTVTVWQESMDDFEAFAFDGDKKSVRVERRKEGGHSYLWGQVTRSETKPKARKPVKAPDESEAAGGDAHGGHGGAPGGGAAPGGAAPGAHGGMPGPTPGKGAGGPSKGQPGKSAPPGGAPPAKSAPGGAPAKSAPDKSGAGSGSSTKPPTQSLSPHHAGTDQPGQPAAPTKPATPAKQTTPAKQSAPAKPAKPAGGSAPEGEGESDEGEGDEAGGEGDEAGEAAPAPEPTTAKAKEFPVGKAGEELVANLVHLRALRELGVLTDKQKDDYALTESKENLTVFFKGGKQRSLIVGARVFGGGDRYVMNPDTGKGYVLSNSEIMRHVDGAENALGLKNLHRFQEEAAAPADPHDPKAPKKRDKYPGVAEIEVETPSGKRNLVRHDQADPQSGGTKMGWADKQKPGETDVTFANFLSQVERLKPVDYDPSLDVSKLTKVLTVRYRKSGGDVMGTFEMYRKEAAVSLEVEPSEDAKKEQAEFYVKTELTRVAGKVSRMSAERVAEDVPQLFGAPPKDGKEQKKPRGGAPAPAGKSATDKAAPAPTGADNATPGAGDKSVPDQGGAGK